MNSSIININGFKIEVIDNILYINGTPMHKMINKKEERIINKSSNLNSNVDGDIKCVGDNITINVEGDVTGNIVNASNVIVEGDVTGNVTSKEFNCDGDITGNVNR